MRVVEMSGLAPAPYCGMLLADLGADVVRVERPGTAAKGPAPRLDPIRRGRASIEVDLKTERGVADVKALIEQADVLIEGFRPGVMERLGLGPEVFEASNPKLVYGRVTGWGQDGPLAHRAGHDVNYIAITGALHVIGRKGEPPVIPQNLIGDFAGGGLMLAFGIMAGVFEAKLSGRGQVVDAAMVDGAASLMTYLYGHRLQGVMNDVRGEGPMSGAAPHYGVYETKDGQFMSVAAGEPQFYEVFVKALGLDLNSLPARADKGNWAQLREQFAAIFRTRTRDEWDAHTRDLDACVAPVLSMDEVARHPHNVSRSTFIEVEGVTQPAPAPRFSRTKAETPEPAEPAISPSEALARWGAPTLTGAV
ncbi:MAG: CaiB/BaiF CoA-transferase family protein [Hyphomonadaceae bacterium]|nr:CaiB/BaiF CoA-transferase family protein [Hyphomonadaceae bacterium]